ncbi:hypothetical protein UlMin_023255 [Ulmus minor]
MQTPQAGGNTQDKKSGDFPQDEYFSCGTSHKASSVWVTRLEDVKELSCIVLGDRPIEITLERAWNSLRWTEKHSLVLLVVHGIISPPPDYEDNDTFQLYKQLSFSYPSLLDPLMYKRDTRSKAVNRSKGVVGVIKKGHMNGVIYAPISDQGNLRFKDLVGGKRPSANASNGWIGRLLNIFIRDTIIGFLLWELYKQIKGHHYWTMFYMTRMTCHLQIIVFGEGSLVTMSPSVLSVLSFNVNVWVCRFIPS